MFCQFEGKELFSFKPHDNFYINPYRRRKMNRIKRVSLFFRILFQFLFVLFPVVLIIGWIHVPQETVLLGGVIHMNFIPRSYINHILHPLSATDKLLGFFVSTIPMLVDLFILYSLIKLFKLYEQGEIFLINNVKHIRNIGYALLVSQIINPIYEGLMGLVLTLGNPPGHHLRLIAITLDQTNVGILLTGFLVILISWIMA